jgi:hypothetical protein
MTERENSEREQMRAQFVDETPRLWYALYKKLIEEGFSDYQALELTKAFITQRI